MQQIFITLLSFEKHPVKNVHRKFDYFLPYKKRKSNYAIKSVQY